MKKFSKCFLIATSVVMLQAMPVTSALAVEADSEIVEKAYENFSTWNEIVENQDNKNPDGTKLSGDDYIWFQDMDMDGEPEFMTMSKYSVNTDVGNYRYFNVYDVKDGSFNYYDNGDTYKKSTSTVFNSSDNLQPDSFEYSLWKNTETGEYQYLNERGSASVLRGELDSYSTSKNNSDIVISVLDKDKDKAADSNKGCMVSGSDKTVSYAEGIKYYDSFFSNLIPYETIVNKIKISDYNAMSDDEKIQALNSSYKAWAYKENSDIEQPLSELMDSLRAETGELAAPVISEFKELPSNGGNGTMVRSEWSAVEGAEGYEVEHQYNKEGSKNIRTTTDTYFDTGASSPTYEKIRVRAYKTVDGKKVYSDWSNSVDWTYPDSENNGNTQNTKLSAPVISEFYVIQKPEDVGGNGFMIRSEWSAVDGAEGYEIEDFKKSVNETTNIITSTDTFYNGGGSGFDYEKIRVRAYKTVDGKKVYSEWSNSVDWTYPDSENNGNTQNTKLSAPVISEFHELQNPGENGTMIRSEWSAVDGAEGYETEEFCKEIHTGDGVTNIRTSTDTYFDTGASVPAYVKIRVRAYKTVDGKKVYSDWSNYVEYYLNSENNNNTSGNNTSNNNSNNSASATAKDSPKTGDAGVGLAVSGLALAIGTSFIFKKKKD